MADGELRSGRWRFQSKLLHAADGSGPDRVSGRSQIVHTSGVYGSGRGALLRLLTFIEIISVVVRGGNQNPFCTISTQLPPILYLQLCHLACVVFHSFFEKLFTGVIRWHVPDCTFNTRDMFCNSRLCAFGNQHPGGRFTIRLLTCSRPRDIPPDHQFCHTYMFLLSRVRYSPDAFRWATKMVFISGPVC